MKRRTKGKLIGMLFAGALLLGACNQAKENEGEEDAKVTGAEEVSLTAGQTSESLAVDTAGGVISTGFVVETVSAPAAGESIAIDAKYFPDKAFREYLSAYVDIDKNGTLSQSERNGLLGLGSVESAGGLLDGKYDNKKNIERGEMLRAITSFAGIEYFGNLKEIHFEGAYQLKTLSLSNPKLNYVWVTVNSLEEFSIQNTAELNEFYYHGCDTENIVWSEMPKLMHLEISETKVALEDVLQCKELTYLSFSSCIVQASEKVDFAELTNLKEFYCYGSEMLARELDFGRNEKFKKAVFDAAMAEKVVLRNKDVECQVKGDWESCDIRFADELAIDMTASLPDGSIWLSAENFPDVAFRQYLYRYVDSDKDNILTMSERSHVYELGDVDYKGVRKLQREQRKELLKNVYDFEGIQYLENLQKIVLTEDYAVQKLVLDHSMLQELSFQGVVMQELSVQNAESLTSFLGVAAEVTSVDWSSMKQLQYLSFAGTEPIKVDLSEMKNLQCVLLTNAIVDFSKLLQNPNLVHLNMQDCKAEEMLELLDFSKMEKLERVWLTATETPESYWISSMKFGNGFQNSEEGSCWIEITSGITGKVTVGNKGVSIRIIGDEVPCELIYEDELPESMTEELPEVIDLTVCKNLYLASKQ